LQLRACLKSLNDKKAMEKRKTELGHHNKGRKLTNDLGNFVDKSETAQSSVPTIIGNKINFNYGGFIRDPLNEKIAEQLISNYEAATS